MILKLALLQKELKSHGKLGAGAQIRNLALHASLNLEASLLFYCGSALETAFPPQVTFVPWREMGGLLTAFHPRDGLSYSCGGSLAQVRQDAL